MPVVGDSDFLFLERPSRKPWGPDAMPGGDSSDFSTACGQPWNRLAYREPAVDPEEFARETKTNGGEPFMVPVVHPVTIDIEGEPRPDFDDEAYR